VLVAEHAAGGFMSSRMGGASRLGPLSDRPARVAVDARDHGPEPVETVLVTRSGSLPGLAAVARLRTVAVV
jgi:hypothetical protein